MEDMMKEKKSFIRTGIFNTICAVLCAAAATAFIYVMMMMMVARMSGYHAMNYTDIVNKAMDRISTNNMNMLANGLTVGYIPSKEEMEADPEGVFAKLNDSWQRHLKEYSGLRNVDFAVIVSENEDIDRIDLGKEDSYFYKSPAYTGSYKYTLSGKVFSSSFWTSRSVYGIATNDDPYNAGSSRWVGTPPMQYYVHILYKTADTLSHNPEDPFDDMYLSSSLRSFLYSLFIIDQQGDVFAVALAIAALVFLVLYFVSAGYRRNKEGIYLNFFDRIPFEVMIAAVAFAETFMAYGLYSMLKYFSRDIEDYIGFSEMVFLCCAVIFVAGLIGIGFLGTVAVRIKAKTFWKNTLICRAKDFVIKTIAKLALWTAENVPLAVILGISLPIIAVISILEAAFIQDGSEALAFFFVLGRLAEIALALYLIWGYSKLRSGAKRIAAGKTDQAVDEERLFGSYRLFARDLNGVGQSIQLAVDERMKSERTKTALITNVSHDIKTPLTSIINYVDLLKKEDATEDDKKEYLEILSKQSERLKKLIQDLIDASKASAGAMEVELAETDLCTMAKQVAGEYQDKYEKAGLNMVMKNMDEAYMVKADNNLLWRVMDNLFNNTLKYGMPGTRVYLECGQKDSEAFFSIINVSKDELGISEEELMERFVRGDVSRNTEGSGLGLSIARSLMELMGGKLSIKIDGDSFKAVISISPQR